MAEVYEQKSETLKDENVGAVSRNALNKELSIGKAKEKADELEEMLSAESKDVKNVEVDSNDLDDIKFSYKGYEIEYETGGMDLVNVKNANGVTYSFDFINSVLPENVNATNNKNTKDLLARTDLCINAQNIISAKLEKEGLKLGEDLQYVRGPKLQENNIYFTAERVLKPGEKGYKKGKEKTELEYFQLNIVPKKNKDTFIQLKDKATFKNKIE